MELETLARAVSHELKRQGLMLVTAESCTGGWLAQIMTSVAGSSEWFERGFVAYTNLAKREMLGVKTTILSRYGAVSEQTARAMAEGALTHSHAQVAIAITGIAGPSGGTPEKPVGTVCFAWAGKKRDTLGRKQIFAGDREGVRRQAVNAALQGALDFLR
ncbi:MAG: CinA family protein [Gammaproteobacteria bacterium]|nr:CinA family protein [Gammaproteobacteria bacterium]MDH3407000.1 CinA family protein [Gammaproteobacteria bacterium]MDH5487517.1 CinA family protein [Gammaproteobacteria bacterium]